MKKLLWSHSKKPDPIRKKTALCMGVFDGFHQGHRTLIERVKQNTYNLSSGVVTFYPSPAAVLSPETYPGSIMTRRQKCQAFKSFGLSVVLLIDFSLKFSKLTGKQFLEILQKRLNPEYIVVGENFHCGYKNDTSATDIKNIFDTGDVKVEIIPSIRDTVDVISSTRIRKAILAGEFKKANQHLMTPYALDLQLLPKPPTERKISVCRKEIEQILPTSGEYSALIQGSRGEYIAPVKVDSEEICWQQPYKQECKRLYFME